MQMTSIPEFFKDKQIFITGGSGFIGKVLIEKLCRSCPDFKIIYLLMRPKKGKAIEERVEEILKNDLFNLVRENNPDVLKKVVGIAGDISELGLGLNDYDRSVVLGSNIVFHVAASVRFDDPLKKAIIMNTRGTREIMELMLQMPNLIVGVHVSTTYSNAHRDVIEEKVYREHGDWRKAIKIAEKSDDEYKIACLTEKYLGSMRNTYVITKHLAENVVEDYSDRLPLVLYRPGVVVSVWKEPIPGWVDNFNGPIGLNVAVGKGLLRVMFTDSDLILDYASVDVVVKGLITATWCKVNQLEEKLPVYNCSVVSHLKLTQTEAYRIGMDMSDRSPYKTVWYPRCTFTSNSVVFWLLFFFYNIIPGFILDNVLQLLGKQPMAMKILRKVYVAILAVSYFTKKNWVFRNDAFWSLRERLVPEDKEGFYYDMDEFDPFEFALNARIGSSKYLLKEEEDCEENRKLYKRNKALYFFLVYFLFGSLMYLFYKICLRNLLYDNLQIL